MFNIFFMRAERKPTVIATSVKDTNGWKEGGDKEPVNRKILQAQRH